MTVTALIVSGCGNNDNSASGDEGAEENSEVSIQALFDGYTVEGKDGPTNDTVVFHFCHNVYEYWIGTDTTTYGGVYDSTDNVKIEFVNDSNDNGYTLDTTVDGSESGYIVSGDLYIISDIEDDPELDMEVTKIYRDDYLCR